MLTTPGNFRVHHSTDSTGGNCKWPSSAKGGEMQEWWKPKKERRVEDRYLDANQKSERFVPVPFRHVPYLSQILWCSTTGWVDQRFHPTGQGTGRSVQHYSLCNLTGTLEKWCSMKWVWQLAVYHSALVGWEFKNTKVCSTYLAVVRHLRAQTQVVFGYWQCCTWAQQKLTNLVCSSTPRSEARSHSPWRSKVRWKWTPQKLKVYKPILF